MAPPQQETSTMTALFRAIYSSQPFGFDQGILGGILMDARRANSRDGITGALICRADIYLQLLEGPREQVSMALERIRRDDRHAGMQMHDAAQVDGRMFGDWAMLHDPAATCIWSREDVAKGAADRATTNEVVGFFEQLRKHGRSTATP
jgi:hypothetical protein